MPDVITCDIDGTLVWYETEPKYVNGYDLVAAGRPNHAALSWVRDALDLGVDVHFVSGRRASHGLVTIKQLRALLDRPVLPDHLHLLPSDDWSPMKALLHKHDQIRRLGASIHIGDESHDHTAAVSAGAGFLNVEAINRSYWGVEHPSMVDRA